MRIEIISGRNGGTATISGFQTDYTSLLSETDSVIGALNRMKSYTYSMNGGLGILQNAVGDIDARIQTEETKRTALQAAQQKCNSFFTLVSQTDNSCAQLVTQNQDEFYSVNQWSAPSALASFVEPWLEKAGKWITDSTRKIGNDIDHSLQVYNETDFKDLSTEELRDYYNKLVELMNGGELSSDDQIRLKSFMDYLAKTSVDGDMSDRAKARVEMYNQLYERLHPQEAAAIRTFFENSSKDGITENDVSCIKFLAYKSENPAHDAFFSNISNCKVISWTYDKTSHYSPKDQGVNMNIAKDRKNSDGSYFTFFHEIGHNMDDLMCNFYNEFDDSGNKTGVIYLSQALDFYDAMYQDTEAYFTNAVYTVNDSLGKFKLNDESCRQVVEALLDGRKQWTTLNPYERTVYEGIKGALELRIDNKAVSDLVGGITNNTVSGQSLSIYSMIATGGTGHGRNDWLIRDNYWYEGNDHTNKQGAEFFAHYIGYSMTGQTGKLADMQRVFPTTCDYMDKALTAGNFNYSGDADNDAFSSWYTLVTGKE